MSKGYETTLPVSTKILLTRPPRSPLVPRQHQQGDAPVHIGNLALGCIIAAEGKAQFGQPVRLFIVVYLTCYLCRSPFRLPGLHR